MMVEDEEGLWKRMMGEEEGDCGRGELWRRGIVEEGDSGG